MAENNLNILERKIRIVAGIGLIMFGAIKTEFLVSVIGFILLASGLYSHCPVYKLLKINRNVTSNPASKKDSTKNKK